MPRLSEILLLISLLTAADGYLIEQQLQAAQRQPLAQVAASSRRLWLVLHQREEWPWAFYARPNLRLAADQQQAAGLGSRAAMQVPRLLVYAPYYVERGRLKVLSSMAVDVADIYLAALFEAYLDEQLRSRSPYGAELSARAAEMLDDVPAAQRPAALASALADFGAHLTKIALQVEQLSDRRNSPRQLCPLVRQRVALFGAWERNFGEGGFPIQYRPAGGGGRDWETSSARLSRSDKQQFIDAVLEGRWRGDSVLDFSWLCEPLGDR